MERRFTVEAKSFLFTANLGKSLIRLEEKRKGFGGFLSLGIKLSDWLADMVEEAFESQGKEDFARSFRDEARVLKIRMGSNKAGCFLEVAVFVEGGRKGVIRLPEGRGGWGWQRVVDELRILIAHLVAVVLPAAPKEVAGVDGSQLPCPDVSDASLGGLKLSTMEARASVEGGADLGSRPPLGGEAESMEAMKSMAKEFLAQVRAEVDRVIFFGLGLKIKATRGIKRKMARVFSLLGLKPKLLLGFNGRGRHKISRPILRPRPVVAASQGMYNTVREAEFSGQEKASSSQAGLISPAKGEASSAVSEAESSCLAFLGDAGGDEGITGSVSEKTPEVILGESESPAMGVVEGSAPSKGLILRCSGDVAVLGPAAGAVAAVSASPAGKCAVRDPSPAKGLLRRGFLLRRSSDLADIPGGKERLPLVLEPEQVLVPDPVLDPALILDPDPILNPDPGLAHIPKPSESCGGLSGERADPVRGGGLSDEQKMDFQRVFIEMFPDSASCSQGSDPNIPLDDGLTNPQWWLLEWLRDQVKHDDAQLAYLMEVEEEARQLNKVAIPPGAVEGSELMQSELMKVVIRDLGI
jgi:hypothetical protein